jgi:hypothetical protein
VHERDQLVELLQQRRALAGLGDNNRDDVDHSDVS